MCACLACQSEVKTRISALTEKQEIELKQAELKSVVGSLEIQLSQERIARAQDESSHAPSAFSFLVHRS